MNSRARRLHEARAARDSARAAFDSRLDQVKDDLAARSVGGRIADKLGEEVKAALDQALDVAKESKGIIAGTVAALALWSLRNPIISWAAELLGRDPGNEEESSHE